MKGRDDGAASVWLPVCLSVPQGSVVGPLLFLIFINNIYTCLVNCSYHFFADDLQIYCHFLLNFFHDAVFGVNVYVNKTHRVV